jgi:murein DD-endopeptidase MepM/ murein hydrolase activator NlpD
MASRLPAASPFANSDSPLSIVLGRGHNPRIFHLKPWVAVVGTILAIILLAWYLTATLYLVFRDEMLAKLMNQQTEMQYAYEDRLAALRNQIDKVTSRQLLDQNSLEGKLHELISRQSQLETRHAIVATLAEQTGIGDQRGAASTRTVTRPAASLPGNRPSDSLTTGSVRSYAPEFSKPTPDQDPFELRSLTPRDPRAVGGPVKPMQQSKHQDAPASIAVAEARDLADRLERQQVVALENMERKIRSNAHRWSAIFAETGLDASRFVNLGKQSAQGGPMVPLETANNVGKNRSLFDQRLVQVQFALSQTDRMRKVVNTLPIARPMPSEFETTSGFGARSDPFTRASAMHTGIDFRAPSGTAVRATAPGKVVEAGMQGGYGNMVEIDHGGGLTTRYAHMSSIEVDVGDTVAKGEVVGRVGSTGRSTGPHLHYETRIDGDATDPLRFLRAGQKFGMQ